MQVLFRSTYDAGTTLANPSLQERDNGERMTAGDVTSVTDLYFELPALLVEVATRVWLRSACKSEGRKFRMRQRLSTYRTSSDALHQSVTLAACEA